MSETSGVDAQVLSLPKGGGSVADVGASFETDLNTGSGSYAFALTLPAGPDGTVPRLRLRYASGTGNGPFGVGWTFGTMAIARKTDTGVPAYAPGEDAFVLPGVDDLIDVGGGAFRPRVDTMFYRILRKDGGWEVTDTRGTVHVLGANAAARVSATAGGDEHVGAWLLESMTTAANDAVTYAYRADGAQRYPDTIAWGRYELHFVYESRPDRLVDGRYGFLVETNLRCSRIELHALDASPALVRSWNLEYVQSEPAGLSQLARITVRGHAADGSTLDAPSTSFGYTAPAARTLTRVEGTIPGAMPPPFSSGDAELVDWDGDGLPDAFELRAGRARVWPNRGRNRWGVPIALPDLPGPLSLSQPGIAFADLLGDGVTDLLQSTALAARYVPIEEGGGFGRPVTLTRAPRFDVQGTRFVDLDGDGRTDILTMTESFVSAYYRDDGGWSTPRTLPRADAPPADLRDAHVKLADMTGDGLQDLVRVDGAAVRYWPSLGYGRFGDAVELANAPALPRGFDPRRLFLTDVDGDGCADLVYVDAGSVTVWHNRGGRALGAPLVVNRTPATALEDVRVVDFNGTGTVGVLWSNVPCGPSSRTCVFLDLCGGVKPYLLSSIDNGIGLTTAIAYRSSTEYALDAAQSGTPWTTFHPFPVQCVASMRVSDAATGVAVETQYLYGPARYDSALKTFLGFGAVETITGGDATIPAQRTRNLFHLGVDPADPRRPLDADETLLFGALRRRLLATELYGLDGDPAQDRPYRVVTHAYGSRIETAANGARVAVPYETETVESVYERAASSVSTQTITYAVPDQYGNIATQRNVAQRAGAAQPDLDVTTETTFAQNLAANIISLPARITQKLPDGTVVSAKLTLYDGAAFAGLPEGQATSGFVSRVEVLAFTDALAGALYGSGADLPDFASLGYFRRTGEDGWWIAASAYDRTTTPDGPALVRRGARGFSQTTVLDASRSHPVKLVDALGGVTLAEYDARALQTGAVTDTSGARVSDAFDPLGRVVATVSPGDTAALPSASFAYNLSALPISLTTRSRIASGAAPTMDEIDYLDGRGQRLATIVPGEGDAGREYLARDAVVRNARGLEATIYEPHYAASPAYAAPAPGTPATTLRYDALGRMTERREPSGAITRYTYAPGTLTIANSFEGGSITRTTVRTVDALGRTLAVTKQLAGRTVRQTYTYTAQSSIATCVDADGVTTALGYDLLGRLISDQQPATGKTVNVADAIGNVVERRGAAGDRTVSTFDALDRMLTSAAYGAATPDVTYTYLNPGDPAPPDGERNRSGRLWKIADATGTWTYAYDARGRIVTQTRTLSAIGPKVFATDFELDGLGRQVRTTLPEPVDGAGRRVVTYTYGPRGLPTGAPGYVRSAEYDERGRPTRLVYQNGVEQRSEFLPGSARLHRLRVLDASATALRDCTYGYDDAGNTTSVTAPHALEAGTFAYDEFDRLTAATYGDGTAFAYAYTDGGTPTGISDAGSYERDAAGRVTSAPYGTLAFDAFDRLTSLTLGAGGVEQYEYDFRGGRVNYRSASGSTHRVVDASLEFADAHAMVWVTFAGKRVVAFVDGAPAYVHADGRGDPTLFTDGSGAELRRLAFGPFGSLRHDSAAASAVQPVFGGGESDASGLVCLGRRYLDPHLGTFVTPDILIAGAYTLDGWNRYVYCRDNPLRYVDPTGMVSWEDVLAIVGIVVVIAVLIVAACFTGGTTLVAIPGLTITLSGLLVGTAIGVAAGAVIGGIAAAQAGGDLWKGILFGGVMGGLTSFAGGCFAVAIGASLTSLGILGGIAIGAVEGALIGAGTGAAVGFAGGKGTAESILKNMLAGFITGAVIGAALGALSGLIASEGSNAALKVGTLDKYTGAAGPVSTSSNAMAFGQNTAELVAGGNPSGLAGSFVSIGSTSAPITSFAGAFNVGANGALLSIPIGWAPSAILGWGGVALVEGISTSLDVTGTYTFGQQLVLALSVVPFVGLAFGYGTGDGSSWEAAFEDWLNKNFSQASPNVI